jgi:O-antigen ligase
MFLSGTRGAISIPLAGFALFFILRKSGPVLISGVVLLAVVFVFFKFTYLGHDNQYIRRMRTAFNPNDPSLLVRLENQKKLNTYLSSRPFGGGIGHAGVKAKTYVGNTFLSNIATDSWYVLIWAETGIVGLALHLCILLYIIIKASYLIMYRLRDPVLKLKMSALAAGMMGIMVASYGNAVLGTMPTSILVYTSMALLLNARQFDTSPDEADVKP